MTKYQLLCIQKYKWELFIPVPRVYSLTFMINPLNRVFVVVAFCI